MPKALPPDLQERIAEIRKTHLKLRAEPLALLFKRACTYHNKRAKEKAKQLDDLFAEVQYLHEKSPQTQLENAALNYLIYRMETKHACFANLRGHSQLYPVYQVAKNQMLDCISETYPELHKACKRQRI